MKVHDLLFISYDKYAEIIYDNASLSTSELNLLMGIKYYYTEYNDLDPKHVKTYVLEVLDPKKLMLYKFRYDF